jgi:UDP-N-acetylmuramoyl-tripeptide--D-alanyl-D-alanine ligase
VRWDLGLVASICGGSAIGSASVTSVTTDSRHVMPGALFVALRGERHDGHDYIAQAVAAGAAACLVERGRLPAGEVGVEVADPLHALSDLAASYRDGIDVPVVAITGSSGKTTTKDMTAAALGPGTHAAPHSHNNEIGVPLTILATPANASAVVAEVGSRGIGHIAALARVVRPDIAVITNVGPAHLETFGDLATVAAAKWELVESLGSGGIAVIPDDLEPPGRLPAQTVRFGQTAGADLVVGDVGLDDHGRASFTVHHGGDRVALALQVPGRHQADNAAASLAVAVTLGHDLEVAARRVESATLSRWRMEVSEVAVAGGRARLVNDAYNANPASMAAALETVAAMPGRHIAVLGRMHELGAEERDLHVEAGALAARLGFDTVLVVGDDPGIAAGAGDIAMAVPDTASAVAVLGEILRAGDVVVVKASRAAGLESIAAALTRGVAA